MNAICPPIRGAQGRDQNHQDVLPEDAGGEYHQGHHRGSDGHDPFGETGEALSCTCYIWVMMVHSHAILGN